jgi:segregation and condensation protein B
MNDNHDYPEQHPQTPDGVEVVRSDDELEIIHSEDDAEVGSETREISTAPELTGPLPDARTALEAVLLVVDEPVAEVVLAQVLERPTEEVGQLLQALAAEYDEQGRGFELRNVSGGWRLYTREACAPYVERFVRDGQQARLTQAALETLAVVAYRQPVSRSRIAGIRGVNVDAVVRTLVTRGLITEVGTERESGAILYGTTSYFLERLGLDQLDELPPLSDYLPDPYSLDEDDVSTST